MSACLFWATSWYTMSTFSANIEYPSGFVASPSTGIIIGLPSQFFTSSRNMRGANSTQTTLPSLTMSATCDAVVPLEAPRYNTEEPLPRGTSLPPTAMYAASLLLLGSHSLNSFPSERSSLSP